MQTLSALLAYSAVQYGDKVALVTDGRTLSFRELDAFANRIANALAAMGVRKGDRVTLYAPNCWEWIASYHGALKTGAVVNPLNAMLTAVETEFAISDCGAGWVLGSTDHIRALLEREKLDKSVRLVSFGADVPASTYSFNDMLRDHSDRFEPADVAPEDLSTICYTSGTTGHPKGAMLSHGNVMFNTVMTARMHDRTHADTVVTALPLPHVYGNVVMNAALRYGSTLVLHGKFSEAAVLESIEAHRATVFDGVPTMYFRLLDSADLGKRDISSLRLCTVGGQTMPVSRMREVEARFDCPLIELWGMTELAGLGTTFVSDGPVRHGSIGVTLPYVEAKIVDAEDVSITLPPSHSGELMIKGPMVMQGYYRNDQATRETLEPGGWLHTGDIAYIDDQGFIHVVDRKKDVILSAGYNIYPAELERVIAAHADVAMVAVGPMPDAIKGEQAKAYIVPKAGVTPDAEAIIQHCRAHLAAYKLPRLVQFVDALPMTSTSKIMRRKLRELDR